MLTMISPLIAEDGVDVGVEEAATSFIWMIGAIVVLDKDKSTFVLETS